MYLLVSPTYSQFNPAQSANPSSGCFILNQFLKYDLDRMRDERAAPPGFEPGHTDPESAVLPLHHGANFNYGNLFNNQINSNLR